MKPNSNRIKRKAIVFIVEGQSETLVLEPIIKKLYHIANCDYDVQFAPSIENGTKNWWGDFTSNDKTNTRNAEKRIIKLFIDPILTRNGQLPYSYIGEIVHIIDMDGAYIEDSNIIKDPSRIIKTNTNKENKFYAKNKILTANTDNSKATNEHKRKNVDYLCSLKEICCGDNTRIPYSMYFFSSNLDHVLYNNANIPTGYEKTNLAREYGNEFKRNPMDFIKLLNAREGTLTSMSYEESWDFIRERGNHSLEPHTNINLLLDAIIKSSTK